LAFIEDKKDEEEHSNGLINPLIDEEDFVIRTIEETENELNIWINVKTTTSQLLHQTHDEKKKDCKGRTVCIDRNRKYTTEISQIHTTHQYPKER